MLSLRTMPFARHYSVLLDAPADTVSGNSFPCSARGRACLRTKVQLVHPVVTRTERAESVLVATGVEYNSIFFILAAT